MRRETGVTAVLEEELCACCFYFSSVDSDILCLRLFHCLNAAAYITLNDPFNFFLMYFRIQPKRDHPNAVHLIEAAESFSEVPAFSLKMFCFQSLSHPGQMSFLILWQTILAVWLGEEYTFLSY